jgi:lysozyme
MQLTRRAALAGAAVLVPLNAPASAHGAQEVTLTDDDSRAELGELDLRLSGVVNPRRATQAFIFPRDADDARPYGIDLSHHNGSVPWAALRDARVAYVYIKASQGVRGRDGRFTEFWRSATMTGLPLGAYHFLTAGLSGEDQADYYLKRLAEVGGLKKGCLQPVVDLEWDTLGPDFRREVAGHAADGKPLYKDYWATLPKSQVTDCVQAFLDRVTQVLTPLAITPRIYTNRTWWHAKLGDSVRFRGCEIWISDYRKASYAAQQPQSVAGHEYDLWQFTESGRVKVGSEFVGPIDCNVLTKGSVAGITIG